MPNLLLSTALLLLSTITTPPAVSAVTITVGSDLGWTDGLCYRPISHVRPGDVLLFNYGGHDVWRLSSEERMNDCDFSNDENEDEEMMTRQLAGVGESPYRYIITESDISNGSSLYFACSVGSHCSNGNQRLVVHIDPSAPNMEEPIQERDVIPESNYAIGLNDETCALYQSSTTNIDETFDFLENNRLQSYCEEAVFDENDGYYKVSCLSGPATLTPGGVMNSARIMHYPYPTDRRVVIGTNTWEFVQGNPTEEGGVTPVPVNQLYVHHLSGRTVLGQGSEGIRRSDVQIPFPNGYGTLSGDEGDAMIFHIIDLREVDDWLACVECRCRDPTDGTYLDFTPGEETGGVSCCANCTDLTGPTVDYRMRYNVSYADIPEEEVVTNVQMLTADISPAVGRAIEFDVPMYEYIRAGNAKEGMPRIQRLEREGPFNELFKMEFFGDDYAGPETVKFLRCVGHLHIAAIGMWLEDAETGSVICDGEGSYGQKPDEDKGFLTAIKVHSHDPPLEFPADRRVRLITEYNATEFHTGVMGMWFAFISSDVEVDRASAALKVDYCEDTDCNPFMLPDVPMMKCEDTITSHPMCRFGGTCSCEELVIAEGSEGCGGMYSVAEGAIAVNDVCAKHCDACSDEVVVANAGCADALADSPMCSFGGLCDCEEFVNGTGCGGVYTSEFGEIPVNDYCTKHCGACPEEGDGPSQDELIQKEILKTMEDYLAKECVFATPECKDALSNLHSCGSNVFQSLNIMDQNMRAVVTDHGIRLAAEHAKLGAASLHRNEVETTVPLCDTVIGAATESQTAAVEEESQGSPGVFSAIVVASTFALIIAGMVYARNSKKKDGEEDLTVEKAVMVEATAHGDLDGSSGHAIDDEDA